MDDERLALYATAHPGARPYLAAWLRSVLAQNDLGFDLWVGLHEISPREVIESVDDDPRPTWVQGTPGATPTEIREQAIEKMSARYPGIVFVDCDDLLEPGRVAQARRSLGRWD